MVKLTTFIRKAVAIGVAGATLPFLGAAACARDVVIHAGTLIDGTSAAPRTKVSIFIRNERISEIRPGFIDAADADIIDLSDATVLPGFIDTHVHLTKTAPKGSPVAYAVTHTPSDEAFIAAANARATLLAGFTSVRDLGGATSVVVALKRAIEQHIVPGPRIWASGFALGPTGGHGDPANGLDPGITNPLWREKVVDGADEAIKAVRLLHRQGADLVKILPSGGVMSEGDDPEHELMTIAEMQAVVETAHGLGMKVAAHAHGKSAIDNASLVGVDSIEHGSFGDEGSYKLMRQHGTFLVPTLLIADTVSKIAKTHPETLNPAAVRKAQEVAPITIRNLGRAYRSGVKIAFGTDTTGYSPHGENAREFSLLVSAGMSPADAILAATGSAAALLGASKDVGAIQAGRYADIVAVKGDPLADVSKLQNVFFVMQGGAIVKMRGPIE